MTDAQVQAVLKWNEDMQAWKARRAAVKTKERLMCELGVSHNVIDLAIRRGPQYQRPLPADRGRGRPPSINDAVAAAIHVWHAQVLQLDRELAQVRTKEQLARELGVSSSLIHRITRIGFEYKQVCPEQLSSTRENRRRRIAALLRRGLM